MEAGSFAFSLQNLLSLAGKGKGKGKEACSSLC